MSGFFAILWLIFIVAGLLGGVPYLVWMIYTAVKKRWRKLACQIAIPLVAFVLLVVASGLYDRYSHQRDQDGVFACDANFGNAMYGYDSDRSFNGDGYSLTVYVLPDSIRKRFQSVDQELTTEFPKCPDYRDDWDTVHWREAPFDPAYEKYISFALHAYNGDGDSGLAAQQARAFAAINKKGAYYAFFKYDHGDSPGNIDLFIVDIEDGMVYIINLNT